MAVPGDKSISHRALILNAIASGRGTVSGLLESADVQSTRRCLRQLGVTIQGSTVHGRNGRLSPPQGALDCGNSGTTSRLLLGVLASQAFSAQVVGDESLQQRPMARVTDPLSTMGARFRSASGRLPITVTGGALQCGSSQLAVASAQVKSALLIAGLLGEGTLEVTEPRMSRDHTEIMLAAMGVRIDRVRMPNGEHRVTLQGGQDFEARTFSVPGDISSAAFFIVAATIIPGSDVRLEGVGLNPSRTGILDVLTRMGADISITDERVSCGERVGTIRIRHAELVGTTVDDSDIPRMIDEIPVLGVAAAFASGVTTVKDAAELRVKESDRCAQTVDLVRRMGRNCDEQADGFAVEGLANCDAKGFTFDAGLDHRMAMAAAVAGLRSESGVTVLGMNSIQTSFPDFTSTLEALYG